MHLYILHDMHGNQLNLVINDLINSYNYNSCLKLETVNELIKLLSCFNSFVGMQSVSVVRSPSTKHQEN